MVCITIESSLSKSLFFVSGVGVVGGGVVVVVVVVVVGDIGVGVGVVADVLFFSMAVLASVHPSRHKSPQTVSSRMPDSSKTFSIMPTVPVLLLFLLLMLCPISSCRVSSFVSGFDITSCTIVLSSSATLLVVLLLLLFLTIHRSSQ